MCEQEKIRNNEPPSYSRPNIAVRRHSDQVMRTRNFRARNEIVERGTVTKSHKGKKVNAERRVGECDQWKANGQYSKGDSCSFSHDPASGNRRDRRQVGQSSSLAPRAKAQTDGKIHSKGSGRRGESLSGTRGRIPCRNFFGESVRIHHVICGTLPCVASTSQNPDASLVKNVCVDTLRLMGRPAKSRRKVV